MNHDNWKFGAPEKETWGDVKVKVVTARIPGRGLWRGIGVDPGRNFGVAVLNGHTATITYGTFKARPKGERWIYGVDAYDLMANPRRFNAEDSATVEGAAYKKQYGQPDLAHVRMGFVLGLYYIGITVDIKAPATIRAQALGSGKLGGLEVWPELNHNGADALACALFAAGLRKEEVSGTHLELV